MRKERVDFAGAAGLTLFSALLGFNQVVISVVNEGLQPVFFAGLRSVGSAVLVFLWLYFRGRSLAILPGTLLPGLLLGAIFALEFICLFIALDLTTVVRTSVIFYTMPLWMALIAHFVLPGEKISGTKAIGLALAFFGVVIAILFRGGAGNSASLTGDLCALAAAFCWAGIAIVARGTKLREVAPDIQLLWQLAVSAPLLLLAAVFFGPFIRELAPIHLWGLAFQIVVVSFAGFAFWLWLLSIYPAASVAAFSFLAPIFGVLFGWWFLDEALGVPVLIALFFVALGLVLINRPKTSAA